MVLKAVREKGSLTSMEQIQELTSDIGNLTPNLVAAFQISFAPLDRAAKRLLALASVCATHSRIPMPLLEQAFRSHGIGLAQVGADETAATFGALTDAPLRILSRASLLTMDARDPARVTVTVHPLVAQVLLRTLRRKPHAEQQAVVDALLSRLSPLASDPGAFVDLRGDAPHANAFLDVDDAKLPPAVSNRTGVHLALGLSRLGLSAREALAPAEENVALAGARVPRGERDLLEAVEG